MPIYALPDDVVFPDPELAHDSGLLAVGGDLSPERLLLAYRLGIFPWYSEGEPILWHAPPVRCVLDPAQIRLGRSVRKALRRADYQLTLDQAFERVIDACAEIERPDQDGTWITDEMRDAYIALHERGFAHSVESWRDGELVGGVYGVSLGGAFFGESMFASAPDASKVAFVALCRQLERWGFPLVDCQVETPLLRSFGASLVPRAVFRDLLRYAQTLAGRVGRWRFDADIAPSAATVAAVAVAVAADGPDKE